MVRDAQRPRKLDEYEVMLAVERANKVNSELKTKQDYQREGKKPVEDEVEALLHEKYKNYDPRDRERDLQIQDEELAKKRLKKQ
jgi:hypothetical protein